MSAVTRVSSTVTEKERRSPVRGGVKKTQKER